MSGKMSPKFVVLCSLAVGAIYASGYSISSAKTTALASPSSAQTALNTNANSNVNTNTPTADPGQNQVSTAVSPGQSSNKISSSTQPNQSTSRSAQNTSAPPNTSTGTTKPSSAQAKTSTSASSSTSNTSTKTSTNNSPSTANTSTARSSTSQSSGTTNTSSKSSATPAVDTTQKYLDGTYHGSAYNRIGSVSVSVTIKSGKITSAEITACDTHYPESYINPVLPDYVVSHQTTQVPVVSGATLSTEDFYYAVVQALGQAENPNYKG